MNRTYPGSYLTLSAGSELPPAPALRTTRLRTYRLLYYENPTEVIVEHSAAHALQVRVADEFPHTIMDLTAIDEYIASWQK
jgi:hypothetical protein